MSRTDAAGNGADRISSGCAVQATLLFFFLSLFYVFCFLITALAEGGEGPAPTRMGDEAGSSRSPGHALPEHVRPLRTDVRSEVLPVAALSCVYVRKEARRLKRSA